MKKSLLLILMLVFVSLAMAQENNSRLNVKYLKLIDNDTEASRARKTDGNGDKCALIKIQTPNMGEAERNRLEFSADMGTFTYPEKATGEVKLFLTEGCKTLIILHPEYGKLIYPMPISVQGFKTYEMVLEVKKDGPDPVVVISSNYVLIKVTPSDALISIDGNFYPDGSAYISVDEPHDLVVSRSLYHDYEKTIYASSKETMTYEVNLAPAFGWLLIDSSPESGATILVNGVRKGVTPYRSDTLASGEYEVTLMREMYENVTKTVRIVDNNVSEISIPMKPNFANVTITTDAESDIYVDGKLNARGSWTGRLLQGSHKAEARKASHRTTAMALEITAGKDESVKLDAPTPIYGAINVTSSPVEAQVYLDGAEIGKTPFVNNKILIGSHELRFVKQGCAPLVKTITIEEGKMTDVNGKLDSGKTITITTGRSGDEIYVDGVPAGVSPLETEMGYGTHKVKAVRDGRKVEKEINVQINGGPTSLTLEFGKIIRITTDRSGDEIYVDGVSVGVSPLETAMGYGIHKVKAVRDGKKVEKEINVQINGGPTNLTLEFGKIIRITTDRKGDKVYIDGEYVGSTPYQTSLGFGNHKVKVVRGQSEQSKDIVVSLNGGDTNVILEFGRLVKITTDRDGDDIFIDGKKAGVSPLSIDLSFGSHKIRAKRGKKSDERRINVQKDGISSVDLYLRAETPSDWLFHGAKFLLLNGALSTAPQTSFGLTVGQVKQQRGWYVSGMTNFNFSKADLTCDENGLIEDTPLTYSFKEKVTSRWSVTAGGLCKLGCPLYLYAGVGYGKRTLLWKTDDGRLAEPPSGAYKGVSFDAGLMAHIKGFSVSAGVTTIGTGYMEFKAGIGFCLKSGK